MVLNEISDFRIQKKHITVFTLTTYYQFVTFSEFQNIKKCMISGYCRKEAPLLPTPPPPSPHHHYHGSNNIYIVLSSLSAYNYYKSISYASPFASIPALKLSKIIAFSYVEAYKSKYLLYPST